MRKGKTKITFTLLHIYPLDIIVWNRRDTLYFPINHIYDIVRRKASDSHLNVSAWRIWQLAWCSNWSSSHKKFWQKEQRKIRPPIQEVKTVSGDFQRDTDVTRWISVKLGGRGGTYHDPTRCVHTQCSLPHSEDMHRHECSDISCCGTPRLHRSHILPP